MADAFEDEVEPTISIGEYLEGVEEQELEADLVLGGDEGKECTYNKGYVKRQAVFSCLTCTPDGNAGICTACILSCHDGHEIVELWTKRKFKCDCGNSKFGEFYCKLFPGKDAENQDNSYNHNFRGLYCTCNGQYPDPNAEEQVEMIQCCICEDWFHEEHLGLESSDEIPRDEDGEPVYEDLICQSCSNICFFLSLYPSVIKAVGGQQKAATSANENAGNEIASLPCGSSGKTDSGTYSAVVKEVIEKDSAPEESSDKLETGPFASTSSINANVVSFGKCILLDEVKVNCTASGNCNQSAEHSGTCVLGVNLLEIVSTQEKCKAMFLTKNWRELLCRCEHCVEFYSKKRIDFLLDKDDTIAEYEKMAKQKRNEKMEQEEGNELNMLNKLPHVAKMEFLSGVDEMKTEILSFLDSFDSSKPVTAADVHQVFENLAKKRKRVP